MATPVTSIRVTPTIGEFSDVEPGMVFVIPFTIHNVSNAVRRVRFGPPKTNVFRLINTQQSIAPGMKQVIEVEFTSKDVKEFHDTFVVRTEEGEIPIPLHAWFPAPSLVYDPVVDLGRVSAQHPVESKRFKIRNIGKKDGAFRFAVEPHVQGLSLTPQSGIVPAGQEIEVAAHFYPSDVGVFRGVVNVFVDGEAGRRLEVVAEVVESRVAILDKATMEPISRVSFGKLFFGQQRTVQVVLQNYGKHTVSFTVRPPEEGANVTEEETQQGTPPLECFPTEGRIAGNESCVLNLKFAPFQQESSKGWEHSTKGAGHQAREWEVPFAVDVVETEQRLDVLLVGKALPTEVRLSESCFRFPDTPVNDHCDILFSFTNESSELPVTFSLTRIAQFRCDPLQGTVVPKGQQNVLLTFHPNQLGSFRGKIDLSINKGAKVFAITVVGRAVAIGTKKPLVGGIDKIKEDFAHTRKFAAAASSSAPERSFLHSAPVDDNDQQGGQDWMNPGGEYGDDPDLLLMSEWQQKREHNHLYNNFVANSRNIRLYNARVAKGLLTDANPDDIGMVPGEGMKEPVPHVLPREDPLPWPGMAADPDGKKGDGSMALRKALKVDENKLIKKKFRKEPATLNEVRECKLVLSPKDMQNIVIPVKVLDFQQVNVFSVNVKSFFVYNGLKTHVLVTMPAGIREELALSSPMSQVIPPAQIAGFDIAFRSESVQTFQQAIYFTLNETHKLKFVVFAEAIPIDVNLSHNELVFRFQEFGYEPNVTQPVTLTNPGNSDAEFQWVLPDGDAAAFSFSPSSATVPANSSLTVDVTYTPVLASNDSACEALLRVKGGAAAKKLRLSGSVQSTSCSWSLKDNRLDFKKVPVGSTRSMPITLKNHGTNSAVFAFDTSQLASCVTITPLRGRIAAGGSEEVQVQLRAVNSQVIKSQLSCHIRGMKQLLRLQLTAEAKVPDFYIAEPVENQHADSQLAFGGVYVGSQDAMRRIVIQNHDDVTAAFAIDLRPFSAFSLYDSDKRPVEAIATDDDDGSIAGSGQIVIYRPRADDEGSERYAALHADDDDVDGRGSGKGNSYKVSVAPHQQLAFYLCFTPQVVGMLDSFILPMSLAGTDITSASLRPIVVSAEGKKPRLVLSPAMVDFGSRVVIREGTSKVPNRLLVKLSNETDGELQWDLDTRQAEHLGEVFRVEPSSGKLQPGQTSQVQFTFTPLEVRSYTTRYAVYLDGTMHSKDASKYMDITLKGFGSNPSLTFDRKEIVMPAVPLDITSKAIFHVGNDGYESLDLRYKIAGDGKLPVTLSFIEGQTITSNHSSLPVEVSFTSKKPITFTVNIDFFDDNDGIFSIPVTCCADNSLLTTFGYVKSRDQGVAVSAEGDKKPLLLKDLEEGLPDKGDTPRLGGGKQSEGASNTGSNAAAEDLSGPFQYLDATLRKTLSKRTLDRLRTWLNVNILPEPVDDLLSALQVNHGRLLFDVIELLFGKPPPGLRSEKQAANKKENTIQVLEQYNAVLVFLKQYGACVCDVRSEFLLKYDEYCRVGSTDQSNVSRISGAASVASSRSNTGQRQRLSERRFAFRAMHAWITVLFQTIRVFYFSRITWRAIRNLPVTPVTQYFGQIEKWASLANDPSSVGSNLYSVPEALLLKWLSIHASAVFGKIMEKKDTDVAGVRIAAGGKGGAAKGKDGDPSSHTSGAFGDSSGGKDYIRIVNFESDVRDCRAFAACVQTYIPSLAMRFDPTKDTGLVSTATSALDLERNATLLLDGMKEYGMETRVTARDFLDFTARDYLLFTAYLFNALPQYVPKTTIKFKGKLLEKITKQIELSNPTKWAVDYSVSLDGSDEFKIPENKFHLEPKSSGFFSIQVTPRFTRKVEGRVMFLSSRSGTFSAATMVFGLETEVDAESSLRVFDHIETPMYEVLNYEVQVENPFPAPGHFVVQLQQEYVRDANAKPFPEEESIHSFPDAFWSSADTVSLKKSDKAKFVLQFMPCVRGKYKARVVFRDDKIGEFAYTFLATCTAPKPYEVISIQTEANIAAIREITVPLRYTALEKALAQKDERFKMFKGARKAAAPKDADADGREVTYRVEFVNEKFVGPNPFFSGPKVFQLRGTSGTGGAGDGDEGTDGGGDARDKKKGAAKGGAGGGRNAAAGGGADKGASGQSFDVTFSPKGPGTYNCYVVLVSNWDVRIVGIEARSRSPGMKAELEFACPARQQINQDIPLTNSTDKEWSITAALQGEYFGGPREIRVPPGRTRSYPLLFNPTWMCDVSGQLVLRNNDTQEKVTYTLKGRAEEPLAENTIPVECKARETRKITINVPNITFDEVTYTVETDLAFVSGDPRITVGKMEVGRYVLHINPQLSGKSTGSITFITPNKQYVWFVLQVSVLRPPPEDVITIASEVRKGAVAEITISNPSDKVVDFTVRRRGDGLIGDDILTLEPRQQNAVYQLAFAPTKAGEYDGVVSFNNDGIGEYWYKLALVAKEAAPALLNFQCELGKSSANEITIENSTEYDCNMTVANSNETNFTVTPSTLLLKPLSSLRVTITYMPSAIQTPQEAHIRISHPKAGAWDYKCRGAGLPPTKMETIHIVAHVSRTSSMTVTFRNPFPVPKRFLATLRTTPLQPVPPSSAGGSQEHRDSLVGDGGVFALMSKKQSSSLGPFQTLQIPVAYTPTSIAEHRASVVVQLLEQAEAEMKWEFPLLGVAEYSSTEGGAKLVCKSRRQQSQVLAFPLVGLLRDVAAEEFTSELAVSRDAEFRRAAMHSVTLERVTREDFVGKEPPQAQCLFFRFGFAPLRPFAVTAELVVKKASGGMWRFPVQLEAAAPDPDDSIVIEAAVNVIESVSFPLYNVLPQSRPFVAFFTPETPQEFTVSPQRGVLPPMPSSVQDAKGSGQTITVSFASSQYGKTLLGCLVIETDEMQWRYEVRGTLPKYQPPSNVRSKVSNRLRPETEAAIKRTK